MKAKKWLIACITLTLFILGIFSSVIAYVDPYFHYHKPHTDKFYYTLGEQRTQNDGIERHFDYDAMIAGTSMVNFYRTSEMDELFNTNSIKVPAAGAAMYEINNNIKAAIRNNPELKMVMRAIDPMMYFDEPERLRTDMGDYPDYLYDDYYYNDVNYVFNREVMFKIVYQMVVEYLKNAREPGIESFDSYSNLYGLWEHGANVIYPDKDRDLSVRGEPVHISEEEIQRVMENVEKNVCAVARENPDIQFYCFFPPYCAAWWQKLNENGEIYKYLEAERLFIEQMLTCDNIKLFSMSTNTDITTDLNNYYDQIHSGPWLASLMLLWMKEDKYLITSENYEEYLSDMERIYTEFDYNSLLEQEDYEDDAIIVKKLETSYGYRLGEY